MKFNKKRERTITYVVYSPNYKPGESFYSVVDSIKKAFKLALKIGNGCEVYRHLKSINRKGAGLWSGTIRGWEVNHEKYFYEIMRERYLKPDDTTTRVCDQKRKYVPIYRKRRA